MRELVDERLRQSSGNPDFQTVRFAGMTGLKNGDLLDAAERAGFDVLVTVDQNVPHQQNLSGRSISLLILCSPTNRLRDLQSLVPPACDALRSIVRGSVIRIGA